MPYFRMELFVKDLEKTVAFYKEVLGLEELGRREHAVTVGLNNTRLLLTRASRLAEDHYFDRASLEGRLGVGVEMIVEVEDIQAMYERVRATGYPIHEELKEQGWGSTDFRVLDPDGYYLRITS